MTSTHFILSPLADKLVKLYRKFEISPGCLYRGWRMYTDVRGGQRDYNMLWAVIWTCIHMYGKHTVHPLYDEELMGKPLDDDKIIKYIGQLVAYYAKTWHNPSNIGYSQQLLADFKMDDAGKMQALSICELNYKEACLCTKQLALDDRKDLTEVEKKIILGLNAFNFDHLQSLYGDRVTTLNQNKLMDEFKKYNALVGNAKNTRIYNSWSWKLNPHVELPLRHVETKHHKKLKCLGDGATCKVYRMKNKSTGDIFCWKNMVSDAGQEWIREVISLHNLKHKNMISLRDFEIVPPKPRFSIYIDSAEMSLYDLMYESDLNIPVKSIWHQCLQILAYLETQHYAHRDFKPGNIVYDSKEKSIKLIDFGMARHMSERIYHPEHEMTNMVSTLWYRAPELLMGSRWYDSKIDVWSLGCIIAEIVCDKVLFEGEGATETLWMQYQFFGIPDAKENPELSQLPYFNPLCAPQFTEKYSNHLWDRIRDHLGDHAVLVLRDMLQINPKHRKTASQLLTYNYWRTNN